MKRMIVIALLAVCASVYATGGISGVVTDSATGLPIHNARVSCRADSSVTYTDSTGYYLISSLPPGEYTVRASASGYAGDTYLEPVVVVDSQVTDSINFALVHLPPTGISGYVTDYESGEPIYHATLNGGGLPTVYSDSNGAYFISANTGWYAVWCSKTGYENGIYPESIHVESGSITEGINYALLSTTGKTGIGGRLTDGSRELGIGDGVVIASGPNGCDTATSVPTGGYVISDLPLGKYEVTATAVGFRPGVAPDSVLVESGQVKWCPFYMQPESVPATGISGHITNYENGEPIYHATVSGNGLPTKYTDSTGAYFIPAGPGEYTLWAWHDGYENGIYPESIHVEQGVVTDSIDFALISITGKTGIGGRLTDQVKMLGIGGGTVIASGPHGCDTATSVPTGGYVISELATGKYQVTASAEGFQTKVYPESVAVESGQVKWCPFYMQPESTFFGGMAGNVTNPRNGLALFGALVTVTPAGHGCANTGTQGTYKFQNLAPGTYLVSASANGFKASAWDTVHVTAGKTADLSFVLQPSSYGTGGITGNVSDSAGHNRISNARVFAWGSEGQGYVYSDAGGNIVVTGLADGSYRVRAEAQGYYPACYPQSVEIAGGHITSSIDFRLRRVGSSVAGIAGFAYDGYQQAEIPGAHVRVTGGQNSTEGYTGGSGDYVLTGLPPGDYLVEVEAPGYELGQYPDFVTVANGTVASFISPALYPLTSVAEPQAQVSIPTSTYITAAPNPARGSVRVQWQVKEPGIVKLRVFDNAGRAVRTLQNGYQAAGRYSANWNGICDNGMRAANGVLFYTLDAPGVHRVVKVTLVSR